MGQIQAIYRWVMRARLDSLESAPYEELFRKYQSAKTRERQKIYDEFCRRLSRLVYLAALDYCKRQKVKDLEAEAGRLKDKAFRAFVPQMGAGDPDFGLSCFANSIRSVLDNEAFRCIARAFYYQLPLYHVPDDEERRFLAAMFEEQALSSLQDMSYLEELSDRFHVPLERTRVIVKAGYRHLRKILVEDFDKEELMNLTEGYVVVP